MRLFSSYMETSIRAARIFLVWLVVFFAQGMMYTAHRGFDFPEITVLASIFAVIATAYLVTQISKVGHYRLFVALEIPSAVRESLADLLKTLRAVSLRTRWVRPENLHVTLKFIGEVPEAKSSAIRGALAGVRSEQPVTLDFRGLGFFSNEKHPRVFWAGIEASPNLKFLAAEIESAMEKVGIPREQRPFSPHLTLARFEPPRLPEKLRGAIHEHAARDFGSLRTNQFHLIESKLKSSGAEYTTVESFPFAAAEA